MAVVRQVTRGVVLRTFRHTDRTHILKALTERFGSRSYMVRSGGRGGASPALLEPLARVELVVSEDPERDLQRLHEVRSVGPYERVHLDPVRGTLAMFMQEVLYHALRQDAPDPRLFAFVEERLEVLDAEDLDPVIFPIRLLLGLAERAGVFPNIQGSEQERFFDPREGHFIIGPPQHADCFDERLSSDLAQLIEAWPSEPAQRSSVDRRQALLEGLLLYFRLHLPGFGRLNSPEILRSVLR